MKKRLMGEDRSVVWYDNNADEIADRYESLSPAGIHSWLLDYIPAQHGGTVLDVGSGTGRDAAWLAGLGYEVVAVEPSKAMRNQAWKRHPNARVHWIDDRLPEINGVRALRMRFDLILLSAVWMHIPLRDRPVAFRLLLQLLQPSGMLVMTLRQGAVSAERGIGPTSVNEIECLAKGHGARVKHIGGTNDLLGRIDVTWANVAVSVPSIVPTVHGLT